GPLRAGRGLDTRAMGAAEESDGPGRRDGRLLRVGDRVRPGLHAVRGVAHPRPVVPTRDRGRVAGLRPRMRVPRRPGPGRDAGGGRHWTRDLCGCIVGVESVLGMTPPGSMEEGRNMARSDAPAPRGRGAGFNPMNRFKTTRHELELDQVADDEDY